jgi:hypothetical protein
MATRVMPLLAEKVESTAVITSAEKRSGSTTRIIFTRIFK